MAKFTPDFLQELRDRLRLSDYVGRRVQLRRNGTESTGLCPFHSEKTPSFTVSDAKGFYHCFGCGAHGSVIDWLMETEGLPFPEAVQRLAADANMAMPVETAEDRAATARRKTLHEVLESACAWYQSALAGPEGARARAYLAERGLDGDTIATFRIGYAPDGRGRLRTALIAAGATEDQLVAAGLMKRPDDGGALRDYFFDRVMFPITDDRGRVVGFGGRTLGDSAAKYLNSPDTEVFHKGGLLYNIQAARTAARGAGTVIAVEGYMDVIALQRAGITHAVAPLGTALTERQIELMWRMADEPVLCFDGDNAGQRAAARAADRALPHLQPGKSLRFVSLPPGEDPDSLLRTAGATGLGKTLASTRPLIELVWETAVASYRLDTPEQRAALQAELRKQAARIDDPTVKSHYDSMLRDRFYAALRDMRQRRPDDRRQRRMTPGVERKDPRTRPPSARQRATHALLATAVNHPEIGDDIYEPLSALEIEEPEFARLRDATVDWLADGANPAESNDESADNDADADRNDAGNVTAGIDRTALDRHLRAHGFGRVLNWLLSDRIYVHAKFAGPSATADEALRGWFSFYQGLEASEVRLAKEQAKAEFRTDPSPRTLRRIEEFAAQERQALATGDGMEQSPVVKSSAAGD